MIPPPRRLLDLVLTAALSAALGVAPACDVDPEAEREARFLASLPAEANLAVRAPGDEDRVAARAPSRPGVFEAGLTALPSEYHEQTVAITSRLDGALRGLATGLRAAIKGRRPTAATEDRLIWRGRAVEGSERALVIERHDDARYTFQLIRRELGGAWRTVVAGEHTPAGRVGNGQGAIWVDLDADADPMTTGTILALWSTLGGKRTLTAFFYGWRPAPGEATVDATFHYVRRSDGSGLLVFRAALEVLLRPETEALEDAMVITRWAPDGAGRADARARGGDIAAEGAELGARSQCWRAGDFEVTFEETVLKPVGGPFVTIGSTGQPMACAFAQPGQAILPPLGVAPPMPAPVDDPALQ